MTITTLLIDLDDTLYPASCGLWDAIRGRINLYLTERLGLNAERAAALRRDLFHKYGTTLRGLQAVYQVNSEDYLHFVHDLPLERYLSPNPRLCQVLQALPQRRVIFTNADAAHACRVVHALGLDGCFEDIIDVHVFDPFCKPMAEAFQAAFNRLRVAPDECTLVDDTLRNLETAKSLGMGTIWVCADGPAPSPAVDAVVGDITELENVLRKKTTDNNDPPQ
ncbi:MAG TPA: pyrimidine 5'-nucleotidase [Anaerolineaceae bacterium]|nr:pyrimidine 5'-nucleotidase [Anaerolineaceae bacterium]